MANAIDRGYTHANRGRPTVPYGECRNLFKADCISAFGPRVGSAAFLEHGRHRSKKPEPFLQPLAKTTNQVSLLLTLLLA